MSTELAAAKRTMTHAHETGANLCDPFLSLAPASGVSVSVLAGRNGQSTVCASNATAARIDELQFDLGEGPCWVAMETRAPVLDPMGAEGVHPRWPIFSEAVRSDGLGSHVGSIFAFPLAVGPLDIGAIDLYSIRRHALEPEQIADVTELARVAAFQVLRRILIDGTVDPDDETSMASGSRREVHQATGIILAQLGVGAADAALLLRAHAFSTGRSVRDVANDVVAKRLDFTCDDRDVGDVGED